jgi:phage FluMu protein Com
MARWTVDCPRCKSNFTQSEIEPPSEMIDFYWGAPKPEFLEGSVSLECPHCKTVSRYERYQLIYSEADA